ncbi:MAG: diaminopimelate epimerase [Pseudomonadota bacterium]
MNISFHKMHGLGNDFMIVDTRGVSISLAPEQIRQLGDRRFGVGFDQLILLEPSENPEADVFMRILNCDGSEAEACGNATRCVARLIMDGDDKAACAIETVAGLLQATGQGEVITVNMGKPRLDWQEIPLAEPFDTIAVDLRVGPLVNPCAVNIGNPHAVFFVPDADQVDLAHYGPLVETDPMFPKKTNVEIVHMIDEHTLRMRVWERGVGITGACGSGAAAAVVAAHRRDFIGRQAMVQLDGGVLTFNWDIDTDELFMAGPAAYVYKGEMRIPA